MKSYIAKQPKHVKERIEAKLDRSLAQKLEQYCQYLDSDRDYVVSQALEIAFKKDKGFGEWLGSQGTPEPADPPGAEAVTEPGPARKVLRAHGPQEMAAEAGMPTALEGPLG